MIFSGLTVRVTDASSCVSSTLSVLLATSNTSSFINCDDAIPSANNDDDDDSRDTMITAVFLGKCESFLVTDFRHLHGDDRNPSRPRNS